MGVSGKCFSWALGLLSLALIGIAVYLVDHQRQRILNPLEDYLRFGKFTRDVNDLNYYLHGHILFSSPEHKEKISVDLSKTQQTQRNITDYYLEHIRNSVNHYEGEDVLQRNTRLEDIISQNELENIMLEVFQQKKYSNITSDGTIYFTIGTNRTLEQAMDASRRANNADKQALDLTIKELDNGSKIVFVFLALGVTIALIVFFQCAFLPQTFAVYEKRNKKSRKKSSRMSKETHYIHLGLHCITTLAFIIFISLYISKVNQFDKNTSTQPAFDFLRIVKDYYAQMRLQQVEDLIHIYSTGVIDQQLEIKHYEEFLEAGKAIRKSNSFSIAFKDLKADYMRYLFSVDCEEEVIIDNNKARALCLENLQNNKHKLLLGQWSKSSSAHQIRDYSEIFQEQILRDYFQAQYCHALLKRFQSEFEKYVEEQWEENVQFLAQLAITLGFFAIFWIPFFTDSKRSKKEAQRFEMVNQI